MILSPTRRDLHRPASASKFVALSIVVCVALITVAPSCLQMALAQEESDAISQFRAAVSEPFSVYWEAKRLEDAAAADSIGGEAPEAIRTVADSALDEFTTAVRRAWPFSQTDAASDAGRALVDAHEVTNAYFEGDATRDAAVAAWLKISDKYPSALEHDEALVRARSLAMNVTGPEKTPDVALAKQLIDRLAARPGPPSALTLRAEAARIWTYEDLDAQLAEANQLLESLAGRNNPAWMQEHLLTPNAAETPDSYLRRVTGYLIHFAAVRDDVARDTIELGRRKDELAVLEGRIAELQAAAAALKTSPSEDVLLSDGPLSHEAPLPPDAPDLLAAPDLATAPPIRGATAAQSATSAGTVSQQSSAVQTSAAGQSSSSRNRRTPRRLFSRRRVR